MSPESADCENSQLKFCKTVSITPRICEASVIMNVSDFQEWLLIESYRPSYSVYFGVNAASNEWLLQAYPSYNDKNRRLVVIVTRYGESVRLVSGSCDITVDGILTHHDIGPVGASFQPESDVFRTSLRMTGKELIIKVSLTYTRIDKKVDSLFNFGCLDLPLTFDIDTLQARTSAVLSSDMEKLFLSGAGADIYFVLGSQNIPAHRAILMARFPYFESMMKSGMKEASNSEITINDDDFSSFSEMLKFIYCGRIPKNLKEVADKLLPLADKYQLAYLAKVCEGSMLNNISSENVYNTLVLADKHGCSELKKACLKLMNENRDQMEAETLEKLKDYPSLLIDIVKAI